MTPAQSAMILKNLFPYWAADISFAIGCPCIYVNPENEMDVTYWTAKVANDDKIPPDEPDYWEPVDFNQFGISYYQEATTEPTGSLVLYLTDDGTPGGNPLFTEEPRIRLTQKFDAPPGAANDFALCGYTLSPDFITLTVYSVLLNPVTILGQLPAIFGAVKFTVTASTY